LEKKRRCSWIESPDQKHVVWARANVRLNTCPKSYITAQSIEWLERYQVQRTFGFGDVMRLPARDVDAYCLIENEIIGEKKRAQQ
jgi:hypothetical protein